MDRLKQGISDVELHSLDSVGNKYFSAIVDSGNQYISINTPT